MTKKKTKTHQKPRTLSARDRIPFIEHFYELRRRLTYVALSMVLFGGIGYGIQQSLIGTLLKPAAGQQFIYTSPGGGINFLFQVCIYFGIILSIPVMVFQLLKYMQPLIPKDSRRFIARCGIFSVILAMFGLCFGYFVGLPSALHFLSNQFKTDQINPLFTIQEYMSFVSIYLIGSAALFQIPLIMLFINRIKPLKPLKLLKIERFVVLGAFVMAAFITPTPDILNQCLIAGPIIAVYQFGIVLVWLHNRKSHVSRRTLEKRDAKARAERLERLEAAERLVMPTLPTKPKVPALAIREPALKVAAASAPSIQPEIVQPAPQPVAPEVSPLVNRYRRNRPIERREITYRRRPIMDGLSDIRPIGTFS